MDNIKDENLKRLGRYIADALINQATMTERDDWIETNIKDHAIGELARCMTLQNLYKLSSICPMFFHTFPVREYAVTTPLSYCIKHLTPSNFGCINTGLL